MGQSSQWHRQLLIRSALKLLDLKGKVLLGDREYIGLAWFAALKLAGIGLVIRLRVSDYQKAIEASGKAIAKLESKAKAQLGKVIEQPFMLNTHPYLFVLVAYRNRSGKIEFLRLITTLTAGEAVTYYQQRYRIESMFKHLKSNGFDGSGQPSGSPAFAIWLQSSVDDGSGGTSVHVGRHLWLD